MTDAARYEAALSYAAEKHAGQRRIGGDAYITHPMAVSACLKEWGYGLDYQIAGLFHDLLEDTDAGEKMIEALGGGEVLRAVKLLTKKPSYVMAEYVSAIKADPMARAVKAADRLHNLRCAHVAGEDFKHRYIQETEKWYMDLSDQIPGAVEALKRSLADQ